MIYINIYIKKLQLFKNFTVFRDIIVQITIPSKINVKRRKILNFHSILKFCLRSFFDIAFSLVLKMLQI